MKKILVISVILVTIVILSLAISTIPAYAGGPSPATPSQLTLILEQLVSQEKGLLDQGRYNDALMVAKQIESVSQQLQTALKKQPAINIISPNGNEIWQAEKKYDIKWKYSGPANEVVYIELVDLSTKHGKVYPITDNVLATKQNFSWTIPNNIPYGMYYKISIGSPKEGKPPIWGDYSDGFFAITNVGKLTVSLDSTTPKSSQVIAGTNGIEFAKIKLVANQIEDISIKKVQVTATWSGQLRPSMIKNISLWDGPNQIGSTIAALDVSGRATFNLPANHLIIPAASIKILTIKADVTVPGCTISLGIAANGISYAGVASCQTTTIPSAPISGNIMYVYQTKLTFTINPSTPSGTAYAGTSKTVMFFNVTNDGPYDGYLHSINFTINHIPGNGGLSTSQTDRTFYLYDASDLSKFITTTTFYAGQTYNGSNLYFEINKVGYEIPAGTTKTFVLVGDTTDMGTGNPSATTYLQLDIRDGSKVNWTDGISSISSIYTKTFPISGGSLAYLH
jgi:hypothetical protein